MLMTVALIVAITSSAPSHEVERMGITHVGVNALATAVLATVVIGAGGGAVGGVTEGRRWATDEE